LTYSVVTPVHNESDHLPRLAECLAAQTLQPLVWVIVDDGSKDGTLELAERNAGEHDWIELVRIDGAGRPARGGPVVRSFVVGSSTLHADADVVVKLDADVSMDGDSVERLVSAFASDERLGIASGVVYELFDGVWKPRFGTGTSVWGACRAYRRACLRAVSPFEERAGWDTVDEHKAQARGWSTKTLPDLPFRHHRREGERDGRSVSAWQLQGAVSYYLHYRPTYLLLRSLFHATRDPAAVAILVGYLDSLARRLPRCADTDVTRRIRDQQRLRNVRHRLSEARGVAP
jgi:glycosyltransferase involved in cell wall biosynthesis